MIPLSHYLGLSVILFVIGVMGVMVRRNIIVILLCLELMLNAVIISFVAIARSLNSLDGHVIALVVLTVTAGHVAVGIAVMLNVFRTKGTTNSDEINTLKW